MKARNSFLPQTGVPQLERRYVFLSFLAGPVIAACKRTGLNKKSRVERLFLFLRSFWKPQLILCERLFKNGMACTPLTGGAS